MKIKILVLLCALASIPLIAEEHGAEAPAVVVNSLDEAGSSGGAGGPSADGTTRFQRRHGVKVFVGEFSAIAWAPNAEGWLAEAISLFEEFGWDWTYHAFREFPGWSVEQEAISRGRGAENFRPSTDNPRMRVLKNALLGEVPPREQEK